MALAITAVCVKASAGDFTAREVTVANRDADIELAGTVTVPTGSRPVAALVLATGSGAQDRDETLQGDKRPFKTLAEYLSGHGYAVLRMDDRGTGASGGDFASAVTADFVTDIAAGLQYMDSCFADVPKGVAGHSEGGTVAIIAAARGLCDFIVTLAAPAWQGDSIVMSQAGAMATALTGRWDGEARQRRFLDIAKADTPDFQARIALYTAMADAAGDAAKIPAVRAQLSQQAGMMLSPWYRAMLRYNPAPDIMAVKVPWLALNGTLDKQVLPENLATINTLNPGATTMALPGHNHLMQECVTGLPQEYATIAGDISPAALASILHWLDSTVTTPH